MTAPRPRAASVRPRQVVIGAAATVAVVLLAFVVAVAAPPPTHPRELCGSFLPLIGDHGYYENCDSIAFIELAEDPSHLFDEMQIRQSRPVFIVMGATTGLLTRPVGELLGLSEDGSFRIGYRVLNAILLGLAVALAWALLARAGIDMVLRGCVIAVLVVNGVTKAFIWTAHTAMFTMLEPVLLVAIASSVLKRRRMSIPTFAVYGLVLGVAFLAYGSFIVGIPVILVARYLALRRARALELRLFALEIATLGATFALPSIVWIGTVRLVTGSYYSAETAAYRQFVWVFDSLGVSVGRLVSDFGQNTLHFLDTLVSPDLLPVLIVAAVVLVLVPRVGGDRAATDGDDSTLAVAAAIVLVSQLLFHWAMGFNESRLTFAIVPPLLFLVALQTQRFAARSAWVHPVALTVTGSWIAMQTLREGPFN